jgi:hypothetical protein
LDWFEIEHTLRGGNREADELANAAMDQGSGRMAPPLAARPLSPPQAQQEFNGIVRGGKIELMNGSLPDGTAVQVRIKR